MAANKVVTLGPFTLTTSAADIFGPPSLTLSGGANNPPPATTWTAYYIIRALRVTNKTASAATFTLYKTTTAGTTAGKELFVLKNVAPNDVFEDFVPIRIAASETDKFITGLASANTALVVSAIAEVGIE